MTLPLQEGVNRIISASDLAGSLADVICNVMDEVDHDDLLVALEAYEPNDCEEAAAKAMAVFMLNEERG